MAKYVRKFSGDFDTCIKDIEEMVLKGSLSASYEDGTDYQVEEVRVATRVFERYSLAGSNRLSLSITLVGRGRALFISAITAGGSEGLLFKLNTFGEEAFLDTFQRDFEGKY